MIQDPTRPNGELEIRTLAMPRDTNPAGDIFGGWLLAQMDVAGSLLAAKRAHGRVVTVAVDSMTFHAPVRVGDVLACYVAVERVGTTSLTVIVEAWAERGEGHHEHVKVTEGRFVFVAIDANGRKHPLPPEEDGGA